MDLNFTNRAELVLLGIFYNASPAKRVKALDDGSCIHIVSTAQLAYQVGI